MSVQLRMSSSRERRQNNFRCESRRLLYLNNVPDCPLSNEAVCEAVEPDGRACWIALPPNSDDIWCYQHHNEWRQMTARWEKVNQNAEEISVVGLESAKQKILITRQSVYLRRQIQHRFYPRGGDIQDYIEWIQKMEQNTRLLADTLLMSNLNRGPTPETPGIHTMSPPPNDHDRKDKIRILRSPLDPRIPISSLAGLPDDGTILVLKHFYVDVCTDSIRRLYTIVPDLDDSQDYPDSPGTNNQTGADTGTDIIRAWFRIMILNDSDAATLEHAAMSKSIDKFLSGCQASQLEMYCDFFEKAWRPHAVQYLRVAICAQTLAGGDIKTIQLLGGTIPSTTEGLEMIKPCWDILYRWFPTLLTPWTLASICSNFEDYTTVCKLLMLKLYNDHWYDGKSIMGECATGVYLGFIPMSKGDFTSVNGLKQEEGMWVQRQSRNYLCGQMAIGHPLTRAFLSELRKRTASLYLVVYEGTLADATVHPTEPDLFISRHRSAAAG
ncbi:hypothetical protein P3342_012501 [Pyrenophora teres f. teres]|nr:hypothetical protein P3342_012501 [Pyrenophora teres f. teres]